MNTYDYSLVTDRYSANGQVDAPDEASADKLIRQQVATPRGQTQVEKTNLPQVKSLKFTLKKNA